MSIDVIICGAAMVDLIAYVPKLPIKGETIAGSSFQQSNGGKGANQAVQAARIGAEVAFIGCFGDDDHGLRYYNALIAENIDLSASTRQAGVSNGVASIWVDDEGNNSIVIIPGANAYITEAQVLEGIQSLSSTAKVALFQNEIPFEANMIAIQTAHHQHITTIFNPAPYTDSCQELMTFATIVCMNEIELAMMAGMSLDGGDIETKLVEACHKVLVKGPSVVVVTLGSKGARLVNKDKVVSLSAPKVTAVDSVGAGDSFIGCFAALLAQGIDMEESARRAVICASRTVQYKGAQPSYGGSTELESLWL